MRWRTAAALAAGLALAPAAPASAGTLTTPNACRWSFDGIWRGQAIDLTGTGAPRPVAPGSGLTLGATAIHARLPDWVPEYGYNLGVLAEGDNAIPSKVWVALAAAGSAQAVQVRELAVTAHTTITANPDGSFQSATPLDVTVPIPDTAWTAGAGPVAFRQAGPGTLPTVPAGRDGADVTPAGSVFIAATLKGGLGFQLDCQPGSTPPDGRSLTPATAQPFETVPIDSGAPPTPAPAVKPALTLRSSALRAVTGRVAVSLSCTGAPCAGKIAVRTAARVRVGRRLKFVTLTRSSAYAVAAGARATVRLTLTADGRALLRRHARVSVRVTAGDLPPRRMTLRR